METFKLKIVDATRVFFDGDCQCLTIPFVDGGEMAFLARHENTVVPIEAGEMQIKSPDGSIIDAFVGDGFLEFLDNEATIVCTSAQLPDEIDLDRAEKSKAHYEEVLRQHHSHMEYADSKAGLARAMERIRIKNKFK